MRVTKTDWIDTGLLLLEQEGHQAVSAEKLARRLGVTRGSFYHHFGNTDEFTDALLQRWFSGHTIDMMAQAHHPSPHQELENLIELTFTMSIDLENAIRAWARTNPRVAEVMARVEQIRIAKLETLYTLISGDAAKGKVFAQIAYYGLVGAAHAMPPLDNSSLRRVVTDVQTLMMSSL
jgi:AcrR family transcriptional regulator